jgi:hypothetical protein
MGERVFDELARALAEPMPRRRVLRLAGAAFIAAAVPGVRPRVASAHLHPNVPRLYPNITCSALCKGKGSPCGVDFTDKLGQTSCKLGCCVGSNVGLDICCKGEVGGEGVAWCCGASYRCGRVGGQLCVGCSAGQFLCADKRCCRNDQVCYRGDCRDDCPPKTKKCGKNCCTAKQGCKNGKCCDKCGEGGPCCDSAKEYCCREPGDKKSPGRCCKKNTESCCPVGPPGAGKRTCCPKPNKCKRQLLPGDSGLEKSAPYVCCPPDRVVSADDPQCCPPGWVSLGGKLVLPAGGGGGLCCKKDKVCGSGKTVTCCSSGSETVPEFEATCCNGTCVNLRFDEQNCGSCGKACLAGQRCQQGACVAA